MQGFKLAVVKTGLLEHGAALFCLLSAHITVIKFLREIYGVVLFIVLHLREALLDDLLLQLCGLADVTLKCFRLELLNCLQA